MPKKTANNMIEKLKGGNEEMLAVLEMIDAENKRIRRQGRKEGIREIAKKMLAKNMDLQTIFEVTGLKEQEIEKLK